MAETRPVERLTAPDLLMLRPDDLGWPEDIGAIAILDGSRPLATARRSAAAGAAAWEEGMALETSVIGPKRGRLAVIEAEADIQRSPEEVFDYCSDHAHEPEWNIKMTDVAKLTHAPIGLGRR
jgi:hypothetical protein